MVERVRLFTRLSAFLVFLLLSMATLGLVRIIEFCSRQRIDRTVLVNVYSAGLCRLLGMRIQTRGLVMEGPALRVCNHVSWTDIPILAAGLPLRFLAKREVASWPIIGWIAREIGTIFVQRGAGDSAKVRNTGVGFGGRKFSGGFSGRNHHHRCKCETVSPAHARGGHRG
jgi:1-acyl-sn-glycerol-3-phosphate acyltransferase